MRAVKRVVSYGFMVTGLGVMGVASAQSLYVGAGTTGMSLGMAWVPQDRLGVRAELGGLPSYERTFAEDGIDYTGKVRGVRGTVLVDWHVWGGGFRLSAGVSGQNYEGEFSGTPAAGTRLGLGDAQVSLGPDDQYAVRIKLPPVMPYVGLGWGHTPAPGWGVHADLGALIGTPRVRGSISPSLANQVSQLGLDPQAELDRELRTVRDAVQTFKVYPVLAVGVSYRW